MDGMHAEQLLQGRSLDNIQELLDREALRQKMRVASLKTRRQAIDALADFDAANPDGL